jgi:pyochelin biosynthesis protein PchC
MPATVGWLRNYRPVTRPRLRLVCFPHAGAGATVYRGWVELLPPDVELLAVCYPGRQDRLREPFAPSIDALADAITTALVPLSTTPLALFGHSMGSVVAYEVAVKLERIHAVVPRHLFVSGRWAPDRVDDRELHLADDSALVAELKRLGNGELALFEIADIRDLVLSVLRADYHLLASHRRQRLDRVSAPIVAYSGDRDPGCAPHDACGWSAATTGGFTLKVFNGDHFYLVPRASELVSDLIRRSAGTHSRL